MPQRSAPPSYRLHKPTGQAIVLLSGKMFYLGPYGTKVSKAEYDRVVGEWLAAGRMLPSKEASAAPLTIVELCAAYLRFATGYYRKDKGTTSEVERIGAALRIVKELYKRLPACEFSPLKLKACRERMITTGWSRSGINKACQRIARMFRWAVENELVPADVHQSLKAVAGLRQGRTEAPETAPVLPVDDGVVNATLPHLSPVVRAMVELQRLTGMRPGEVCLLRPCDLDTSGDVWLYRPSRHKTQHHGRGRVVAIGPKAQTVLLPFLNRKPVAFCFSPAEAIEQQRQERTRQRKTPAGYGNSRGTNRVATPKRGAAERYIAGAYGNAIRRACDKAFPAPENGQSPEAIKAWQESHRWSPNQLRHTAATEIRRRFGLEAAQVALGHAAANVTQIYAERDLSKAAEVMRILG